jgi:hypothetical protein
MTDAKQAYAQGAQAFVDGKHMNPYYQDKAPAHFAEWAAGYIYARDVYDMLTAEYNAAFQALRSYNAVYVKKYAKEIRAARAARFQGA